LFVIAGVILVEYGLKTRLTADHSETNRIYVFHSDQSAPGFGEPFSSSCGHRQQRGTPDDGTASSFVSYSPLLAARKGQVWLPSRLVFHTSPADLAQGLPRRDRFRI